MPKHCFSIFPKPFHRKSSETKQNIVSSLVHLQLGHLHFRTRWHQPMKKGQSIQTNNDLILWLRAQRLWSLYNLMRFFIDINILFEYGETLFEWYLGGFSSITLWDGIYAIKVHVYANCSC
jgi:hypothetical protein